MVNDKLMALQRAEFDACEELAKQLRRLKLTAIVDNDYPVVRSDYERAAHAFVMARDAVIKARPVGRQG